MVNVAVSWHVAPGATLVHVFDVPPPVRVMSSLPSELFSTVNVTVTGLPAQANAGATGAWQTRLGFRRHVRLALTGPAGTSTAPVQMLLKLPSARAEFGP